MKTYQTLPETWNTNNYLVFGANTQGRHSKGAALLAKEKCGAIYGQAKGLQGHSYAIVTKDLNAKYHPSISKQDIKCQIEKLYEFAKLNSSDNFYVIYKSNSINLCGYTSKELAEMFYMENIPNNVYFEEGFNQLMTKNE